MPYEVISEGRYEPLPEKKVMPAGERLMMGLADPIQGGAQLLTKALPAGVVDAGNRLNNWLADKTGLVAKLPAGGVDQQTKERERAYEASKPDGFDWARFGGNVASPANFAFGGAASLPSSLAARVAASGAAGAAGSALAPVAGDDFWSEKAKQVGVGGAFGAAAPVVGASLSRVISPNASVNPELELLRKAGVKPTIGQTLGGRWNAAEEKLTSLPIVGDAIANARGNALEQFNRAAINRAVEPIGAKVDDVGQVGVAKAGDLLSDAYNSAKARLGYFTMDAQGAGELTSLQRMAQNLPGRERKSFNEVFDLVKSEISPNGSITADGLKRIDSKVGAAAARFGGASDAYQQQLGDALKELQRVVMENAKRAAPDVSADLAKADKGWANLVRLEGAAKSAKNSDGLFTPGQLNMAIQQADKSVRKRAVARGEALMQDLGTAGQNVLGNKVPNSFTTDRLMLGGGAAGAGAYFIDPAVPLGLLGGAALYTSPAQSLLRGAVANRPQSAKAVAKAFKEAAPVLAPATGLLGLQLLNQ